MLRLLILISKLIKNCSKHRIHHLAAAFSYYFILSMPPLIMLIFIISKYFLSSDTLLNSISPFIINIFGSNIYNYILKLLEAVRLNQSLKFYTSISILVLIFTSSSLFVFTKISYSNYKNLLKTKIYLLDWLKTRIFSILLTLFVIAFYFISILVSPILKNVVPYIVRAFDLKMQKFILDYIINPFIFSLFFALYIQMIFERIPTKYAFLSGIVTSFLGKVSNTFLFKWIPSTLAGSVFSKAGSSLIILLYIYYTGIIIFVGFELAATLWEIKSFHRSYRWLTLRHIKRVCNCKKLLIKSRSENIIKTININNKNQKS